MSSSIANSVVLKQVEKALFFRLPSKTEEGEASIVEFFKNLELNKAKYGIKEFSVGLSTLEEVFLELSKRDKFISDEDEEPPLQPGKFEKTITRLGKQFPSIFGPKERVIHSTLFAPFGFVNLVLNMIFNKRQRAYPTAENGIVLKTTRRLLCAPRFNYSAKDVPAEIAKVITQNEWRSLLNQLNNPMLKNSVGPFKWFLWVLLSHFHLLNALTLSEEQMAENGYSFSPLISYVFGC